MYVCVYVCIDVCMHICMYVCMCIWQQHTSPLRSHQSNDGMYVCMYICMYVCMYVCIYVYVQQRMYVSIQYYYKGQQVAAKHH